MRIEQTLQTTQIVHKYYRNGSNRNKASQCLLRTLTICSKDFVCTSSFNLYSNFMFLLLFIDLLLLLFSLYKRAN